MLPHSPQPHGHNLHHCNFYSQNLKILARSRIGICCQKKHQLNINKYLKRNEINFYLAGVTLPSLYIFSDWTKKLWWVLWEPVFLWWRSCKFPSNYFNRKNGVFFMFPMRLALRLWKLVEYELVEQWTCRTTNSTNWTCQITNLVNYELSELQTWQRMNSSNYELLELRTHQTLNWLNLT